MRISDWSSDVCSSDLAWLFAILHNLWRSRLRRELNRTDRFGFDDMDDEPTASGGQWEALQLRDLEAALALLPEAQRALLLLVAVEIGRASCRARGCRDG